jgi:hypothetical protein
MKWAAVLRGTSAATTLPECTSNAATIEAVPCRRSPTARQTMATRRSLTTPCDLNTTAYSLQRLGPWWGPDRAARRRAWRYGHPCGRSEK